LSNEEAKRVEQTTQALRKARRSYLKARAETQRGVNVSKWRVFALITLAHWV